MKAFLYFTGGRFLAPKRTPLQNSHICDWHYAGSILKVAVAVGSNLAPLLHMLGLFCPMTLT